MPDNFDYLSPLIELAFKEDIGDGDHSTRACIPASKTSRAKLIIKEDGVLAGVDVAREIFHRFDPDLTVDVLIKDGTAVHYGDIAFTVEGEIQSILQTERVVLNIMQRMSGIATRTAAYVKKLEGLHTKVLDTRKTTPGMRYLEKLAVKLGGGENHRMGLFDMIMLKDNHIDFAGSITQAVKTTQTYLKERNKDLKILVEVRNFKELDEVLSLEGVHRVMLDNFTPDLARKAVSQIKGRIETEATGGITLETLREFAESGVDYISVGALTHSVKSLDMSLKAF